MTKTGPTRESLVARQAMLKHRIRALPTHELLRLAADFWDDGQKGHAVAVAELALARLRSAERLGVHP